MRQISRILPLVDLPKSFEDLRAEATGEGFRFVDKLAFEWRSGANRFARPGEVLLGAFQTGSLVAIGGLNHDPYTDQGGFGRLRHIYVRRSARRSGLGAELVGQLLAHANGVFHSVRLRTQTQEAADFYVKLGFCSVQDKSASHIISA